MPIALPYRFDTSDVWRKILKGAFGFNALLVFAIIVSVLIQHQPLKALGLAVMALVVLGFTMVFVRYQTGSVGTLLADRVVIEPSVLLGIPLPGPKGTYALDRFAAIRVEMQFGPLGTATPSRPYELVWLVGKPATPDIVLARTEDGAGRDVGRELGALLSLPVEEVGGGIQIRL
jgi:hypothetical protein